jgi:hypothetical protein
MRNTSQRLQHVMKSRPIRTALTLVAAGSIVLALPGVLLAVNLPTAGTGGSSNNPTFEIDGDKLSSGTGRLDWSDGGPGDGVIVASRNSDGTCTQTNSQTLGGPGVNGAGVLVCDGSVGTDKPLSNADGNAFVQGQHEEESPDKASPTGTSTVKWNISAASSPKKTDLAEVMAYAKAGDSVFDADTAVDDLFFVFDATRLDINGDFHVDFELNQVARNDCGDADSTTFCQKRSADDVLISFDTTVAGDLVTSVYKYVTSGSPTCATTSAGIGVPPGCYVLQTAPNQGPGGEPSSVALFNGSEISSPPWRSVGCDPVSGDTKPGCRLRDKMPAGGDMEAYVDLTAFIPNFNPCPGFGQVNPKSRSSSGINSSLQDDAGAIPFNVSICKSLLIRKEGKDANTAATNDLLGGATFTITPNPITGSGSLDVADRTGTTGDANDLNASAGLVCVKVSADGPFSIVEKTAPTNYLKDSSTKTGIAASNSDCATRSTAANSEDAKFINTPLSQIEVKFTSLAGSGVTKASIVCNVGTTAGAVVAANTENNTADPALDDSDEVFGNGTSGLVPGTYVCSVVIDP